MQLEVGEVLEGRVTGITKFGAFVALPGGKSGLVHISEVASSYVNDVHDHLSEGQTVKVKVLAVTPEGKINLSIKRAAETPSPAQERPARAERRSRPAGQSGGGRAAYAARERSGDESFEDKLKQFMQESDSKISGSRIYDQQRKSRRRRD